MTDRPPVRVQFEAAGTRSFDDFYRREFPAIVALANTMVGRSAEDVAQEAMIRAHDRWSSVGAMDKPGSWVRRVTINLATSRLRRRSTELRARLRLLGDRPVSVELATPDDQLFEAVATLPGKQRAAIALHYLEDRSVAEIAEIFACAPSTAKVHLYRGRNALAERLGRPDAIEDAEDGEEGGVR